MAQLTVELSLKRIYEGDDTLRKLRHSVSVCHPI